MGLFGETSDPEPVEKMGALAQAYYFERKLEDVMDILVSVGRGEKNARAVRRWISLNFPDKGRWLPRAMKTPAARKKRRNKR